MIPKVILATLLTGLAFWNGQAEAQEACSSVYADKCSQYFDCMTPGSEEACQYYLPSGANCPLSSTSDPGIMGQDCFLFNLCISPNETWCRNNFMYSDCICPTPPPPTPNPGPTPPQCDSARCDNYFACLTPNAWDLEMCKYSLPQYCKCPSANVSSPFAAPGIPECTNQLDCFLFTHCTSPYETYCRKFFLVSDCICPTTPPTPTTPITVSTPTPTPVPQCEDCTMYASCLRSSQRRPYGPDASWCEYYLKNCTCPTPAPLPQCENCQTFDNCLLNGQGTDMCYESTLQDCTCPLPTFPPGSTPPQCDFMTCFQYENCMGPSSEFYCIDRVWSPFCRCPNQMTYMPGTPNCTSEYELSKCASCTPSANETHCIERYNCMCPLPTPTPVPTATPTPVPQGETPTPTPTPAPLPQCESMQCSTYYAPCLQGAQRIQGPGVDAFWCDIYVQDCTCPAPAPLPLCSNCSTFDNCLQNARATGGDASSCYRYPYEQGCFCPRPALPPGFTPPQCNEGLCNDYNACMTPTSEEDCRQYFPWPGGCNCSSAPGIPECSSSLECRLYNYCVSPSQTCSGRFLIDCVC